MNNVSDNICNFSDSVINSAPSNPQQPVDLFPGIASSTQISAQPLSTQAMSAPQIMPPPYISSAAPASGSDPSFRRIVPTGQETCPNRVVGSGNILSPKTQQVPSVSQYHREYGPTDSWAGQEPLVDLGAFPPPAGINPRMTIPSQISKSTQHAFHVICAETFHC